MLNDSPALPGNVQSIGANGLSWTSVERPSQADLRDLADIWDLRPADLGLVLDGRPTPGILHRERYRLILVSVPLPSVNRQRLTPLGCPVAIFVRPDSLLTIHTGQIRALTRFFEQLAADGASCDAAFAAGIGGVLLSLVQRLVDVAAAAVSQLDHDVSRHAEEPRRVIGPELIAALTDRQHEAGVLRRLVAPWPGLIRELADVDPGLSARGDCDYLARRGDLLIADVDATADALRGLVEVARLAIDLRRTGYVQALTMVIALTLPVLVVAMLLAVPAASPLDSPSNGFAITLAIAAAVFLGALLILRRRGIF
ncbi:MAG: CorA family divalent cation transporter [Chloroflexota bacterium]